MPSKEAVDLGSCDREPIHTPGFIQPHGLLLVVDQSTDVVMQAAGDAGTFVSVTGSLLGKTVQEVLGSSLSGLMKRAETELVREPTYLGTVNPFGDERQLTITAHQVQGISVIEAEPAAWAASAAATLASIRSITERIGGASGTFEACDLAAREVQRITGYDRVMVYKFLPDGTGSVVSEIKAAHLSPFLNHRYPGSDIPKQARELYQRSAIRVIPDVGYTPAPLVQSLTPGTHQPLDMSHCALRSVSPVHIQYLKNMGVGASMSVSLLPQGELWGLIACHNTTPRLVPYEAQEACRHVGQILSQQIRASGEADSFRIARKLEAARDKVLRAIEDSDGPSGLILTLCADIQAIVPSHGVAVVWREAVATAGLVPSEPDIRQLVTWLERRKSGGHFFETHRLSEEYLQGGAITSKASGLVSITLLGDNPMVFVWFRGEQLEEINWAGNPHEPVEAGTRLGALNPRKSFAVWREKVEGRCRRWQPVEIDSAQEFGTRATFVLQQGRARELNHLLIEANARLAALASTDGLTSLANRRAYDEYLQVEWARARRSNRPLSLIALDLDFFKQYNDHYGHMMGDECLKQIAKILQATRRPADLAARTGGEEFSLVLPETDVAGALFVAETVRVGIERLHIDHMTSPMGVMTASFGVAAATPIQTRTVQDLMQTADQALYKAKQSGRNQVQS